MSHRLASMARSTRTGHERPAATRDERIGPWRIESRLPPHQLASRFRVKQSDGSRSALAYLVGIAPASTDTLARISQLAALRHAHILPIHAVLPADRKGCWLIAPYLGGRAGLTSLRDVLASHTAGALPPTESVRLIAQLTDASAHAAAGGCIHGPLGIADVLVSSRGLAVIELYGLGAALADASADRMALSALQARSLGRLAVRATLGAESPRWRRQLRGALPAAVADWITDMAEGCYADPVRARGDMPAAIRHIVQPPEAGSTPGAPTPREANASSSSAVTCPS